jgi:hypothetical protein
MLGQQAVLWRYAAAVKRRAQALGRIPDCACSAIQRWQAQQKNKKLLPGEKSKILPGLATEAA